MQEHPIIIVTGANSGVGLGVCHRLLHQLSTPNPTDALPQALVASGARPQPSPYAGTKGLTLIMACRSVSKAEGARKELLENLDKHLASRSKKGSLNSEFEYAKEFRRNLNIDIVPLDLASLDSVFKFCHEVGHRYPYITHMIMNAGIGAFTGVNWLGFVSQFICTPFEAITRPKFKMQEVGVMSEDGLGWVWQCNIFGHYVMQRQLESLLLRSPMGPSRVLWTSSIEATSKHFDLDDWQCTKTDKSYEHSKCQTELVAQRLALQASQSGSTTRHFVVHPGITATNIFAIHLGWVLDKLMKIVFYLARFFGSTHHNVSHNRGAISAVHVALVSTLLLPPSRPLSTKDRDTSPPPLRYASETNRWAHSYVKPEPLDGWEMRERDGDSDRLMAKYDRLYHAIIGKRGILSDSGASQESLIQ